MAVFIGIYTKFYKNQYIKLFNFLIKDGYKYNNIYIIKRFYKKKEITDLDNSIFQNNGFIYTIIFFLNLYYLLFDYKNIIIKFMERNLLISDYLLYIIEF